MYEIPIGDGSEGCQQGTITDDTSLMSSISQAFQGPDDQNLVIKFLIIELEVIDIENEGGANNKVGKAERGSNDSRKSWKSPYQIQQDKVAPADVSDDISLCNVLQR